MLSAAAIGAAACGGDATAPAAPRTLGPSLTVISGGGGGDTIGARLSTPLTVEVRDSVGRPMFGVTVRFATDTSRAARAYVATGPSPFSDVLVRDVVSDSAGRASVSLRLGEVAGAAAVTIRAPALGLVAADTAEVRAGARARLRVPLDPAVSIGGTTAPGAAVVDRAGNAYADPVTYTSSDPDVSVSAGVVSGRVFGEALVVGTSGRFTAPFRVAVVPRGTIAVRVFGAAIGGGATTGVGVVDVDLSHYRYLTGSLGQPFCSGCALPSVAPRWYPDGSRIAFSAGGFGVDSARVAMTDLSGTTRMLLPTGFAFTWEPAISKDGAWFYFAAMPSGTSRFVLWRARADGSAAEPLAPTNPQEARHERRPDPSPDGRLVAYSAEDVFGPRIRVRDIVTGVRTTVDVVGTSPRWSPLGDLIAFVVTRNSAGYSGELHLIRPDGSGERRLGTGAFAPVFDWSPDGRYIIAQAGDYAGLAVIDVGTGVTIRLTAGAGFAEPAWRPGP